MEMVTREIISMTPPAHPCWVVISYSTPIGERYREVVGRSSVEHEECYPVLALALVREVWEQEEDEPNPGERETSHVIVPVTAYNFWYGADHIAGLPGPDDFWYVYTDHEEAMRSVEDAEARARKIRTLMEQYDREHPKEEKR